MRTVAAIAASSLLSVMAVPEVARPADVPPGAASTPTSADLEEIVVTAEKRAVSTKDLPLSIYAVSGAALEQFGVTAVGDLTQLAPSLQFAKSFNTSYITIRGI